MAAKIAAKFQPTQLKRYEYAGGGTIEMQLTPEMARNVASYRVPENMKVQPSSTPSASNTSQTPIASGGYMPMGQGKMGVSQDPVDRFLDQANRTQQQDRQTLREMDQRNFGESNRRFDVNAEVEREKNRISQAEVDSNNFYRSNQSRIQAFTAQEQASLGREQLQSNTELANRRLEMDNSQFRQSLAHEQQQNFLAQGLDWNKAELQAETLLKQEQAATKRTRIGADATLESGRMQADATRYAANLDYNSRMQQNVFNRSQYANQNWGQMLSSFLSR